jgi:hypothetical protein
VKRKIFPLAFKDYEEIILYYRSLSLKSAEDFILEVERAVELICTHPNAWCSVDEKTRCFSCDRFPYGIY